MTGVQTCALPISSKLRKIIVKEGKGVIKGASNLILGSPQKGKGFKARSSAEQKGYEKELKRLEGKAGRDRAKADFIKKSGDRKSVV